MAKPTRYLREEQLRQIEVMAGLAMSLDQMAAVLGIAPATLDRRIQDQRSVKEAIYKGKASASLKVRAAAFKMATSGTAPVMTIFWLKTQEGFREASPTDVSQPLQQDDDELLRKIPTADLLKLVGKDGDSP